MGENRNMRWLYELCIKWWQKPSPIDIELQDVEMSAMPLIPEELVKSPTPTVPKMPAKPFMPVISDDPAELVIRVHAKPQKY